MIKTYLFIRKGQIAKKIHLNKQALRVMYDVTILIYGLLLLGYFGFALYMEFDFAQAVDLNVVRVEGFTTERLWGIVAVLPFVHLFLAFGNPGVMFGSAQYKLTTLPHSTYGVWFMTVLEQWVKLCFKVTIPAIIVYVVSPTSLPILLFYVCLFVGMNILMTPIKWKLFQMHALIKIAALCISFPLMIVALLYNSFYISVGILLVLLLLNVYIHPRLFHKTDWHRIIAISDFRMWRSALVARVTKMNYKLDKQYSFWQRLSFWKRPFKRRETSVYHRLWYIYFEKNIKIILQFQGAFLLFLFALIFVKKAFFLASYALMVHAYSTVIATMYVDRLKSDIVQTLPWDVARFKNMLIKWAISAYVIFIIPFIVFTFFQPITYSMMQYGIAFVTTYLLLHEKINRRISQWDDTVQMSELLDSGSYLLLILLAFSNQYPRLLIPGCLFAIFLIFYKRRHQTHHR